MRYNLDKIIDRTNTHSARWTLYESPSDERLYGEDYIFLSSADMDFPCSEGIRKALQGVVDYNLYGYTILTENGAADYFGAVQAWLKKRRDWDVTLESILYVPGAMSGVRNALNAFTKPGDGIIINRPVYGPFTSVIEGCGRKVVNNQLIADEAGYYTIDFDDLEEKAKQSDTTAFVLCSPHNPVGRVWMEEELLKVYDICRRNQVIIISDEVHSDFIWKGSEFTSIAKLTGGEGIVTCMGFGKTFNLAALSPANIIVTDKKMLPEIKKQIPYMMTNPFMIAAVIAIASVIPTMFLSSVLTLKGGAYSQNSALFPPIIAGVFGIMQMIAYLGFSGIAIGLANYTLQMIPGVTGMQKVVAMIYLILFFLLGVKGITLSSKLQNIMVFILLGALGIYIVGGLPNVRPDFFTGEGFYTGGTQGFLMATALLSMSSMGASSMINFTSVTKNPQRTIPLAIIASTSLVAVFYFLIAVVTGGVIPVEEVSGQNLGIVAEHFMSRPVYLFFMIGGALFALGTTLNANLAAIPYPWVKMAEDGWLPKCLAIKDKKYQYPYVLMGIIFIIGAVMPIVFGMDIATITSLFSFPSFVVMTLVAISSFRIPKLFPEEWEKSLFHVPTPVFYVLTAIAACACMFLAYSYIDFLNAKTLTFALAVLTLIAVYAGWRYKAGYVNMSK